MLVFWGTISFDSELPSAAFTRTPDPGSPYAIAVPSGDQTGKFAP